MQRRTRKARHRRAGAPGSPQKGCLAVFFCCVCTRAPGPRLGVEFDSELGRGQGKWRKATERDLHAAFTERDACGLLLGARVIVGQRPCPALPVRGPYDDPYGRGHLSSNGIGQVVTQVYDIKWVEDNGVFAVENGVSQEKWKKVAGASMQKPAGAERCKDNARGVAIASSMFAVFTGTREEWLEEARQQELNALKRLPTRLEMEADSD